MATVHSATVGIDAVYNEIISGAGIASGPAPGARWNEQLRLTTGTDVGKINLGYAVSESAIAASSTTVYDFNGGVSDTEGNALTYVKLVLIAVRNTRPIADAGAYIEFGPDATAGLAIHADGPVKSLTDRIRVPVGAGWVYWYSPNGWPVAPSFSELAIDASAIAGDTNAWDFLALGRTV